MINRGMDVKDLVNSELLYVSIWKDVPVFSSVAALTIAPYNGEIEDIEFNDPGVLFAKQDSSEGVVSSFEMLKQQMKERINSNIAKDPSSKVNTKEEYEMQFHYIYMEFI